MHVAFVVPLNSSTNNRSLEMICRAVRTWSVPLTMGTLVGEPCGDGQVRSVGMLARDFLALALASLA